MSDVMRRYAATLAAELRAARPAGTPSVGARDLVPAYTLFRERFGSSPEATAIFRAEIAGALAGGDEGLVTAALDEIGSAPHGAAPAPIRWHRLCSDLVVGCLLLGFGLVIGFVAPRVRLDCWRPSSPAPCASSCRLYWDVLFGTVPIRDTAIACLQGVEHVRREAAGESGTNGTNVYYQVLLSAGGEPYAMNIAGAHDPTLAAAEQIRTFLAAPDQRTLRVRLRPTGSDKWMARVGDGLLVLGLITVLSVPFLVVRSLLARVRG